MTRFFLRKASPPFRQWLIDGGRMPDFLISGMARSWNERRIVKTGEWSLRYSILRAELSLFLDEAARISQKLEDQRGRRGSSRVS